MKLQLKMAWCKDGSLGCCLLKRLHVEHYLLRQGLVGGVGGAGATGGADAMGAVGAMGAAGGLGAAGLQELWGLREILPDKWPLKEYHS